MNLNSNLRRVVLAAGFGLAFLAGAGITAAAPLLGPEGSFSSFLGRLEYDPSQACSKPHKPYSDDTDARDAYRNDGLRYLQCLERATKSDIEYASDVILDGYKKAGEDFVRESRRP